MTTAALIDRDPVTFEVIRSGLYGICAEMKAVIMRASFSPLLSLSADLSCALLDSQGNVVAQGNDIPVHLGANPFTVRSALSVFPIDTWEPGHGVILNDPYMGGTHLPDVSLLMPVFADKRLCAFSLSRVHWPDIGGIAAGSSSVSDEILKEGLRIPPLRIIENWVPRGDILQMILANCRVPEERMGDFQAQIAGARRAERRLLELVERYGVGTLAEAMADSQTYSERILRYRLSQLPDAVVCNEERLDGDGFSNETRPIIKVRIEKTGNRLVVDFTGSTASVRGPINAPYAVTASAVYYTVLALGGGDIPPNNGVYKVADIKATEGSIVHAAYPSAVVAANTETSNRLVDIMLGALAQAYPDRVPAGSYGSACVYTLGGMHPVSQRRFVHYETIGGGAGATAHRHGAGGLRVHMGNTMNLPIEATEAAMPVRYVCYELIRSSGGAGQHAGGAGVRKTIAFLADGMEFSVLGERTLSPAHGLHGGESGGLAQFRHVTREGHVTALDAKSGPHRVSMGDTLDLCTAGGGGWGKCTE